MTTSSKTSMTWSINIGLVQTSMAIAPRPMSRLRKPIENDEPTTVCTKVVSLVSRDNTSPDWVFSKKVGLCSSTWA